ncbi:MAG: anti-sigma factor family protein [Rhodospirillales bacterium]
MSERIPNITDEDLLGFVDGRLDPARHADVARHLADHPEIAEEVDGYKDLNAALRAKYEPVLEEPIPARLLRAAARGRVPGPTGVRSVLRVAALVALSVAVGGIGGWLWRDASIEPPAWSDFARQAAAAHLVYVPEIQHPVEVTADRQTQLVQWLSRRIGARIEAPTLSDVGFRLIGGRLLPAGDGPAAQLMYEDGAGKRIAIYLRADIQNDREIAFQFTRARDVNVLYWLDGPRGFALSGDLNRSEMLRIAEVFYDELGS